jgi:hypothetical protein
MPTDDSFRFDDCDGFENAWKKTVEQYEKRLVCTLRAHLWSPTEDDIQLMSKRKVFDLDLRRSAEPVSDEATEQNDERPHYGRSFFDSPMNANRSKSTRIGF